MWDYDKLFAEGNIIGVNIKCKNVFNISSVDNENVYEWKLYYANDELKYQDNEHRDYESYIQYIIRLDEYGNVVERLFDRERDMANHIPELETGMFVKIADKTNWRDNTVAYVDYQNNRVIAKEGWYEKLSNRDEWQCLKIVEVFSKNVCCFNQCVDSRIIWRSPDYQTYLDSKVNL